MPTMNKKIVLFNGPPGSGKDPIVSALVPYLKFQHMKFAAPIKRMIAGLFDIRLSVLEQGKDLPSKILNGDTPRDLHIAISEDLLKKRYGDDFLGRIALHEATRSSNRLLLYSDCGFQEEVEHVVRAVGPSNCLLIRLHREGRTFEHDSRSYLPDGMCASVDVHNNDVMHNVAMRCLRHIVRHLHVELEKEPDQWIK